MFCPYRTKKQVHTGTEDTQNAVITFMLPGGTHVLYNSGQQPVKNGSLADRCSGSTDLPANLRVSAFMWNHSSLSAWPGQGVGRSDSCPGRNGLLPGWRLPVPFASITRLTGVGTPTSLLTLTLTIRVGGAQFGIFALGAE